MYISAGWFHRWRVQISNIILYQTTVKGIFFVQDIVLSLHFPTYCLRSFRPIRADQIAQEREDEQESRKCSYELRNTFRGESGKRTYTRKQSHNHRNSWTSRVL